MMSSKLPPKRRDGQTAKEWYGDSVTIDFEQMKAKDKQEEANKLIDIFTGVYDDGSALALKRPADHKGKGNQFTVRNKAVSFKFGKEKINNLKASITVIADHFRDDCKACKRSRLQGVFQYHKSHIKKYAGLCGPCHVSITSYIHPFYPVTQMSFLPLL